MSTRSRIIGATAAAVLAAGGLVLQPVLQAVGEFLGPRDPLVAADAAIAISGNNPERVATASRLVRERYARVLILSGSPGSIAEMRRLAQSSGILEKQILIDDAAMSTWENALGSARLMKSHRMGTAILVTSPYHMRRAVVLFRAVFRPQRLVVRALPAENSTFQVEGWWRRSRDRAFVLREYAKLLGVLVGIRE